MLIKQWPSVLGGRAGYAWVLQKPLRLGHSHASMAAALALHGFAGAATVHPLEGVVSNEVRTRGQLHKASIATDR